MNEYDKQAADFLARNGIEFRAQLRNTRTPQWSDDGPHGHHYRVSLRKPRNKYCGELGKFYLSFDFWGSLAEKHAPQQIQEKLWKEEQARRDALTMAEVDAKMGFNRTTREKKAAASAAKLAEIEARIADLTGQLAAAKDAINLRPYSVLARLSSDIYCPETFADFCAEYGYDEDSRKAEQTFRRCLAFSRKLHAFFTEAEIEQLSEIQ